jgi:hypothetical protein
MRIKIDLSDFDTSKLFYVKLGSMSGKLVESFYEWRKREENDDHDTLQIDNMRLSFKNLYKRIMDKFSHNLKGEQIGSQHLAIYSHPRNVLCFAPCKPPIKETLRPDLQSTRNTSNIYGRGPQKDHKHESVLLVDKNNLNDVKKL